ncbi:PadR family transcriptional regulator [Lachnospiraceae bacterium WCA-9-b2]|jgi:DNA-binding PadR family transcriptional regulator|uniref:PadR family transcriptional regulator n=1 Tax=Sporofaciens musculi TaxID=2681861 RepID=A0A7X3MJB6_9FIRM|nr:helix-turn-helix transcriptional regulator [Sporofaciens musculi]MCI9422937.1 PadR family transcriptional regulator [Dorea sp.]MXP77369.1 PadR family transcriptional regulator [Sporofaciens musculi]
MAVDKSLVSGSTSMLILRLLEEKDMYGYEMIEGLRRKSRNVFEMKAGTLYPLLHGMETKGMLRSYTLSDAVQAHQSEKAGKTRKYYSITKEGRKALAKKKEEWLAYTQAVADVLSMGGAV